MTPTDIYDKICSFANRPTTIICDLHSACTPKKGNVYLCPHPGSQIQVIDFDEIKVLADKARGRASRKSVDALTLAPSHSYLCFIELKSWELLLANNGSERKIRTQSDKYASDLPIKLSDSMQICAEITKESDTFKGCRILYILLTDISVNDSGLLALNSDLAALAGTSSDLRQLCNSLSQGVMDGITNVETRYWECRNFDDELAAL